MYCRWVNQNQTYRQEIDGGYVWSPKVKKSGYRNLFYEFMHEVPPGDAGRRITHRGQKKRIL